METEAWRSDLQRNEFIRFTQTPCSWQVISVERKMLANSSQFISFYSPPKFWGSSPILAFLPPSQRRKDPSSLPSHTHPVCPEPILSLWTLRSDPGRHWCGLFNTTMESLSSAHSFLHPGPLDLEPPSYSVQKDGNIVSVVTAHIPNLPPSSVLDSGGHSHGKGKQKDTWEIHFLTGHVSEF